jgi:hypothetical protein
MKKKGNDIVIKTLAGDLIVYFLGNYFKYTRQERENVPFLPKQVTRDFSDPKKDQISFL